MATLNFRAFVALLVTGLIMAGCVTTAPQQQGTTTTGVRPVAAATAPAPAAAPAPAPAVTPAPASVVETFPTSRKPAQGKPWTTMHEQGFTGNYGEASKLLGLSSAQAKKYEEMHATGACQVVEVPNGVVLDRLTFTRDGRHQVDYGAKVALENPSSRKTEVCNLGGGTIAMRFHGCGNHAVVHGWVPPAVQAVKTSTCSAKVGEVMVWQKDVLGKVEGLSEGIDLVRAGKIGYFNPNEVSRKFGKSLRSFGTKADSASLVTVRLLRSNGGVVEIYKGRVSWKQRFELPSDASGDEIVQIVFDSQEEYVYPPRDLRGKVSEYHGECEINASHAIRR